MRCHICKYETMEKTNYCPNCGAEADVKPNFPSVIYVGGTPVSVSDDEDPRDVLELLEEETVTNVLDIEIPEEQNTKWAYYWFHKDKVPAKWEVDKDPEIKHVLSKPSSDHIKRYNELILCRVSKRKAQAFDEYYLNQSIQSEYASQEPLVAAANMSWKGDKRTIHPYFQDEREKIELQFDGVDQLMSKLTHKPGANPDDVI